MRLNYKFHEKSMEQIGVFISYNHEDNMICKDLILKLKNNNINVLSDDLIPAGAEDFHVVIKDMLFRATCAIILYNKNMTPWVMFEIGVLKGMNKKIFIYSISNKEIPKWLSDCEIIHNEEEIMQKVKQINLFSDLLENDSNRYNHLDFNDYIRNKTKYISLKIQIPGISHIDSNAFQFRYIVPGLFKTEMKKERRLDVCYKIGEQLNECNCQCFKNYNSCPYNKFDIPIGNKEIIVLNKTYDAINIHNDEIEYLIPINIQYGVTFKCFVDIKDFSMKDEIIGLLINAGVISADESGSAKTDRIYFQLPKKNNLGLFSIQTEEGFFNNYFCPGVLN